MIERLELPSSDGVVLEAELATSTVAERAAMVLCHPHPQFGGTMRSLVISELFGALPAAGVTCLRFNFRGVESSTGAYDEGRGERDDTHTAVRALAGTSDAPLVLTGWSFGADMALSVRDDQIVGWLAIAPPLHFASELDALAGDPRPKHLALAEHDEFRAPAEILEQTEGWASTTVEVVPGASHFFVGRTDRLVAAAQEFVERVAPTESPGTQPIR
ncbi:MAG: alpha/beta family hydrolase [Acidimicrobiia bacterium]